MTAPTTFCILCPDRQRVPDEGVVCRACRSWLGNVLGDVRAYAAQLAAGPDLVPDNRVAPVALIECDKRGRRLPNGRHVEQDNDGGFAMVQNRRPAWRDLDDNLVLRRRDPINTALPSGSNGVAVGGGPVSGSKTRPLPISEDKADILGHARQGSRAPQARGALGLDDDQVGHLPLATVLDTWVRDWRNRRRCGEGLPPTDIDSMCGWLRDRLDWALDEHPLIDEFAEDMRDYRSAMAGQLGLFDAPELKVGVACPKCDARMLFRQNGNTWIECGQCPVIMSPIEYAEWTAESQDRVVQTTVTAMAIAMAQSSK